MSDERRQFPVLYRDFLSRILDIEILSSRGDLTDLAGRVVTLLASLGLVFSYLGAARNVNGYEFVASATVASAGLFAVFSWNAVFPSRRDSMVLGLLPVRTRTMVAARAAALATALAGIVVALNFFTSLFFVFNSAESLTGGLRGFAAWWIAMFGAGAFALCVFLCVQGFASQLFPWRTFLQVSGPLQLISLFAVLTLFFLTPPFLLTIRAGSAVAAFIPSYWFTGLLLLLRGDRDPSYRTLAAMAIRNLFAALAGAALVYVAAWTRNLRRIAESPEIAPSGPFGFRFSALPRLLAPKQFDRAILVFAFRTLARSRQHRLLVAAYGGMAFALTLAFSGSFLFGADRQPWTHPSVALLTAGILTLSISLAGMRSIFGLPQTLPANWIVRVTQVNSQRDYFFATRRALLLLGALPVWIAAAIFYGSLWPAPQAAGHMLFLVLGGLLFADLTLHRFRKVPFTCSWLPAGARLRMKIGVAMLVFVIFASVFATFELSALTDVRRYAEMMAVLAAAEWWAAKRNREFAESPSSRLIFDELPESDELRLDLRADGEWAEV